MKRHLLSAADLSRDDAELVLTHRRRRCCSLADRPIKKLPALRGRTVVNLFFEDSTRTRISFEAAAKRLSADVINFSAKGSIAVQGRVPQGHRPDPGGDGRRRGRGPPRRQRRAAPARPLGLGPLQRGQRRRRHPRAPHPGAARRVHDVAPPRRASRAGSRAAVAIVGDVLHSRVARSNALLLQTLGAEVTLVAPPTLLPVGIDTWGVETSYDLDAVLPKADAVMMLRVQRGADERRVLPDRARVLPPLRPRRPPDGDAAGPHDRDAPRPDGPRHGDHRRRRRLRPLGDRRAGHQRGRRADGRALPAARRRRDHAVAEENELSTTYLIKNVADPRRRPDRPAAARRRDRRRGSAGSPRPSRRRGRSTPTGLIALPGLVDLHTHLREPGREDAETVETGTQAAAMGGFTAVHAMANTEPVADTAGVVEQVWRLGREAGYCDVYPVGAVTVGLAGERLAELGAMADSAARVRVFSDDGKCVSDAVLMRRALEYVKAFDGVIAQHAQEPRLTEGAQMNEGELSGRLGLAGWPAVAEEAIIARDCLLAAHVGSRLHVCHVSTAGSVEIVREAKRKGWNVTAEACPHHLLLTDELAATYDPIYKVNPPLRTAADVEALRAGLADGTIDIVATDHAPHPHEDKDCEWAAAAFGMLGLETALSVVQETMVDTGPARLGRRRRADVLRPGPDRPGQRPRPADRGGGAGQRRALRPGRDAARSTPPSRRRCRATRRTPAWSCPAGWSRRSCAARPPCSTGSLRLMAHAGARGRPHLPR